jgi:sulfide dehydrogenase [flavocytochrome c] flavoprotein chain
MNMDRRLLLKMSAAGAVGYPLLLPARFSARNRKNTKKALVVIVGGGIGGATAARYIRGYDQEIDVTLITKETMYYSNLSSALVISGNIEIDNLKHSYRTLEAEGIHVKYDAVVDISDHAVITKSGKRYLYDRCIVSPGVDFKYIKGHNDHVAESKIPHAWRSGKQMQLLKMKIQSMRNGGVVVVSAPRNPFSCPPAPYERVSMIADYLKREKPRSKIFLLDPKDKFSLFGLNMEGWRTHYGYGTSNSLITWVRGKDGGSAESVSSRDMSVTCEFEIFHADVINVIPDQKAGKIAFEAGLTSGDWCPVDLDTFESKRRANIHVIGDASMARGLPKSGFVAASQAKVCAAAIVSELSGRTQLEPSFSNTCYSMISTAPKDAVYVSAVYRLRSDKVRAEKIAGGLSPSGPNKNSRYRRQDFDNAVAAHKNFLMNIFGGA